MDLLRLRLIFYLPKESIYLLENNKILLATSNTGKLKEFRKMFSNFEIKSQADLGIDEPIEGRTNFFRECSY